LETASSPVRLQSRDALAKRIYLSPRFIYFLLAFGALTRLAQYLANRPLWLDEAMITLNIINRSYPELLQPLDYVQAAPVLFLLAVKYCCELWGDSEIVLRFVPFIFGLLALAVFYPLGRRMIRPQAMPIALTLFAFSRYAIHYAVEVKPYSLDLAFTVIVLLFSFCVLTGGFRFKNCLALGLAGAAAVWCSHAVIFVMAGAGAALLIEAWLNRKNWGYRPVVQTTWVCVLWAASFLCSYYLFVLPTVHPNFFIFWEYCFFPFPPLTLNDLTWLPSTVLSLINNPLGLVTPGLVIMAMIAGTVYYWRSRKRFHLLLFFLPLVALLSASALGLYPISDRLVLFILPLCYLLMAEGAYQIFACCHRERILEAAFLMLLLIYPVGGGAKRLISPHSAQETRPVISYFLESRQEDEPIYMNFSAQYAFQYYTRERPVEYHIWEEPIGATVYLNLRFFEMEEQFIESGRAWFYIAYFPVQDIPAAILKSFLDARGTLIDSYSAAGTALYLYDFSAADRR
jgi:uncharacterized membrane protein